MRPATWVRARQLPHLMLGFGIRNYTLRSLIVHIY